MAEQKHPPLVVVYVITYRRAHLLSRALESLVAQTLGDWEARVVNDDPADDEVTKLIATMGDPRISLHQPMVRRGAAGAFNEAFRGTDGEFISVLEDDNWWEPSFLQVMVAALRNHPEVVVACMNERIWKQIGNSWVTNGQTIWPEGPDRLHHLVVERTAASATICNSSMLIRRTEDKSFVTPDDIPVDVTEHFRERLFPQPMLLVNEPLVNFSETTSSNRDQIGITWAAYQILLIASCFLSVTPDRRHSLARRLLAPEGGQCSPEVASLLLAGAHFPKAFALWRVANGKQRLRVLATLLVRFPRMIKLHSKLSSPRLQRHLQALLSSPFNRSLEQSF
jgi:glycosyltransferase involved in cell wall biosynthesis